MAKGNIVYHNIRMNLDNEQHRRIHAVLAELNTDVHRSVNQFLIDAADFYIESLNGESVHIGKKSKTEPISSEDLQKLRTELKDELKNEIIMLLGTALVKGTGAMPWMGAENTYERNETKEPEYNPLVESLVDGWG